MEIRGVPKHVDFMLDYLHIYRHTHAQFANYIFPPNGNTEYINRMDLD